MECIYFVGLILTLDAKVDFAQAPISINGVRGALMKCQHGDGDDAVMNEIDY